jgi:two-component system LytT family response regulator
MRVVIVDDEPPARALVAEYLAEDFPEVEVVAACGTGREAVAALNDEAPDLVFLDVQMPGLSGLDVLDRLDALPDVIFVTAYDEHAVRAFDAGAVDYLLKPFTRARFRKAVERAQARQRRAEAPAQHLAPLLHDRDRPGRADDAPLRRLYVRTGSRIVPVDADDVLYVEAAGDYAKLHTAETTHLCNLGIGALDERLDPERFLRVHRSYLVALPAVEHLVSDGSGGYVATLTGGARVRVSRTYADRIRDLIA